MPEATIAESLDSHSCKPDWYLRSAVEVVESLRWFVVNEPLLKQLDMAGVEVLRWVALNVTSFYFLDKIEAYRYSLLAYLDFARYEHRFWLQRTLARKEFRLHIERHRLVFEIYCYN